MMALRELIEGGHETVEVRQEVHDRYNEEVDRLHEGMVWRHPGITNWYRNPAGRVFAVLPHRLIDFWRMTSTFEPAEYRLA